MSWMQFTLQCPQADVERYEDALLELGAQSVTIMDAADNPVLEPLPGQTPLWEQNLVTGLFEAQVDSAFIQQQLHITLGLPDEAVRFQVLPDQDWERSWMDNFQPMRFGQKLWIVPSWHQAPDPEAANILLDPGLAFGTGTHPTTALCLEWLDAHRPEGLQVVDYGCGSGILALAALKLGARHVAGVDIDEQALIASRDNANKNELAEACLDLYYPEQYTQAEPVDLLLANILSGPLVELSATLATLVKPGGQIVLSGILPDQADAVLDAYARWFDMQPIVRREDWVRLTGTKR